MSREERGTRRGAAPPRRSTDLADGVLRGTPPDSETSLRERWRKRGWQAGIEMFTAVLALLVCTTPLREHMSGPGLWVLADFGAGILVFAMLMAREDAFGKVFVLTLFGSGAFLALWMLFDGLILLPGLLVVYSVRAWFLARRPGARPMEGVLRVTAAVMLAGIPAALAHSWVGSPVLTEALLGVLFFLGSGWCYLYPPLEWINSYEPPSSTSRGRKQ